MISMLHDFLWQAALILYKFFLQKIDALCMPFWAIVRGLKALGLSKT